MSQRDVSSFLPNLLGPIDLQTNGAAVSAPRRSTINLKGDVVVTDNPTTLATDIAFLEGGIILANAVTGSQNNIASTDANGAKVSAIRFSGVAPTVTGITSDLAGVAEARARKLVLMAMGGPLVLSHESGSSAAANRITSSTGSAVTIPQNGAALLVYDVTSSRWLIASVGAASGGSSSTTGTGFWHNTSGSLDAASKKVDLTAAADVTVPATANGVITSSGTVLQQPARVLAGAGFVSVVAGAGDGNPAASGDYRGSYIVKFRGLNSTATQDLSLVELDGSNNLLLGTDSGFTSANQVVNAKLFATTAIYIGLGAGVTYLNLTSSLINAGKPIVGTSADSSPFSVHGRATQAMADANQTLAAAVYSREGQKFTGALTAIRTATYPHPSSEDNSYFKDAEVATTGFGVTMSTGTGSTVAMGVGAKARLQFSPSGVTAVASFSTA